MGLLARILGIAPRSEWDGLSLDESSAWEVEPTKSRAAFLLALPQLLPSDSVVYFEGTSEAEVEDLLERNIVPHPARIAIGTIWPRPKTYHVPCTAEVMASLAQIIESRSEPYLCTHIHAYKVQKVLLEWHDAFETDPMRISRSIDEAAVSAFASALGVGYSGRSE